MHGYDESANGPRIALAATTKKNLRYLEWMIREQKSGTTLQLQACKCCLQHFSDYFCRATFWIKLKVSQMDFARGGGGERVRDRWHTPEDKQARISSQAKMSMFANTAEKKLSTMIDDFPK